MDCKICHHHRGDCGKIVEMSSKIVIYVDFVSSDLGRCNLVWKFAAGHVSLAAVLLVASCVLGAPAQCTVGVAKHGAKGIGPSSLASTIIILYYLP